MANALGRRDDRGRSQRGVSRSEGFGDVTNALSYVPNPVGDVSDIANFIHMYRTDPDFKAQVNRLPEVQDMGQLDVDLYGDITGGKTFSLTDEQLRAVSLLPIVSAGMMKGVKNAKDAAIAGQVAQVGSFPTNTAGRIQRQAPAGYTVHMGTGEVPTTGVMMGKYGNEDPRTLVTANKLGRSDIESTVNTNRKALTRPENYLGAWTDPDTSISYLEPSQRFDPSEVRQATKYGERTGQIVGYDIESAQNVPVGQWTDYVQGPEFAGRMDEMARLGNTYLQQHPTNEWWDIHGTSLERVYGRENLDKVAGYTASTAPQNQPTPNLREASEYLRRDLAGEPVYQPDWRTGEQGSLLNTTRNPDKRLGMDASRRANVLRVEAGNTAGLTSNKVNSQARAMLGDENAVVLDRHWARLGEDPSQGVFTHTSEGVVPPGEPYELMESQVAAAAQRAGRSPRDYSADVWTGIREQIKNNNELYGVKYRAGSIQGESKGYADIFEDLVKEKAEKLGMTVQALEQKLRSGDANLLSLMLASPILAGVLGNLDGASEDATETF